MDFEFIDAISRRKKWTKLFILKDHNSIAINISESQNLNQPYDSQVEITDTETFIPPSCD